ncbi:S-methyl-5-thioribose-1-phosphate isomerase [Candidatus Sumerlaeota bacterium]|nr:S-methyl-5-thioribose-1-phosphate isomerase [Candidatus Sumerlaeota bacterium]
MKHMPVRTIYWEDDCCKIVDQTLLPTEFKTIELRSAEEAWEAIKALRVRGAPAIGIAAAFGVYLGVRDADGDAAGLIAKVKTVADYLASSRPTAVNLFWALDRVVAKAASMQDAESHAFKAALLELAQTMIDEDNAVCRAIGEYGTALLNDGDTILTHCNAGGLATASYGTALAPVLVAMEQGKTISVIADETRPLLQGARLTAWECRENGVPVTLICDVASGTVMQQGRVQAVIVGTDRTTANGDVCNKIGTYNVAVLAARHGIPFYVAAPLSSIDMSLASGDEIPIEERDADEVRNGFGKQTAPDGVKIFNPAFDVTPAELVTALITEKGVVRPPYKENLKRLFSA